MSKTLLKKEFVNHKKFLFDTIGLAHKAVQSDKGNQDPVQTRFLYQECSQRFRILSPFLPETHSKVLNKFSKAYSDRAKNIHNELKETKDAHSKIKLPEALSLKDEKCNVRLDKNKIKRSFSLMLRLRKTMLKERGFFFLPNFYVPQEIWSQRNFKIENSNEKELLFKKTLENLTNLSFLKNGNEKIEGLEEFKRKFDKDYQILKNSSVKTKKHKPLLKGGLFKGKKNKKPTNRNLNEEYMNCLVAFFDKSQFFMQWIENAEKDKNYGHIILQRIEEISYTFYFQVLINVVFKDMFALIENYFRQCRQQFSRLKSTQ